MSTQRRRLGKGLGALLGESAVEAARTGEGGVTHVNVQRIVPNRFQPRETFADDAIDELAASIASKGVLQPLIVTPREEGGYMLVSGERRWRAAQRAGLDAVPVLIRKVTDPELLEIALIENLQREDLDPIEEATGYRRLVEEFELSQAEVGTRVGRSRPAVANALRLLELPDVVQRMVRGGKLSAGHGRALLGLADRSRITVLARKAARAGHSVRHVERLVRRENAAGETKSKARARVDDVTAAARAEIEADLQRMLGTRVKIHVRRDGKGRIEVHFYSFEDLERVVERIGRLDQ